MKLFACKNRNFHAVGEWYEDFSQTSDDEVRELLHRAKEQIRPAPMSAVVARRVLKTESVTDASFS